jgi:plasmid maintenance system killer protein
LKLAVPLEFRLRTQIGSDLSSAVFTQPGLRLHELIGNRSGTWSVTVSGNWRVTFIFVGEDAEVVNYEDYH